MRLLHFDIISGIAGDMTLAALCHLGADLEPLRDAMRAMGLGQVELALERVSAGGIVARKFSAKEQSHDHSHRNLGDIEKLIRQANLPPGAQDRALDIFGRLAQAEGRVHGQSAQQVTFHEVGAIDSIADIVGCALALDQLAPDKITSSPVVLGHGLTRSQHGPIPVPAPATVELLRGLPTQGLPVAAELTTPTGAAILASQVDSFCDWPAMRPEAIGYGGGTRELPGRPNLLRVILGQAVDGTAEEEELLIEANIDDMNPEHYEHLLDRLFQAGAHDVWLQAVLMKKSRPGTVVSILCSSGLAEQLEHILFLETTTIGLRRHVVKRRKLARRHESVETPWGVVRVKVAGEGDQTYTASPEYEDCRAIARREEIALPEVFTAAMIAWREKG